MKVTPIKPSGIVLLTTNRCSAACDNCCFGCNPKQGRSMTYEEMKHYVDISLEAYPDSISSLDLTGGECMLLGKDVDRIFTYARSKGLKCTMVSNAFWATDYDNAAKILTRLKRCGLSEASFSTGNDHDKYVPWTNVRNAAVAAANLGIKTDLRIEGHYGSWDIQGELEQDPTVRTLINQGNLKISSSPWMQYHNKGKKPRNYKWDFYDSGRKDSCKSLFQNVVINAYGEVYACCGIGVCHIPQMRLGNVNQEPIKTIYERAFDDFLKVWLFLDGPEAVLRFVHKKTGQKFNWHTSHICDLCRAIFTDKTIIPFLRENFFESAYMPMITYECIAKSNNESRTRR